LAAALPEHDGAVAELPVAADLGRVRGVDLWPRVGAVLVHRADSRPRHAARPRQGRDPEADLRRHVDGLAWLGAALAQLRAGLPAARWSVDAPGALGALGGFVRLRVGADAGVARDDLPAVLRRRSGV